MYDALYMKSNRWGVGVLRELQGRGRFCCGLFVRATNVQTAVSSINVAEQAGLVIWPHWRSWGLMGVLDNLYESSVSS